MFCSVSIGIIIDAIHLIEELTGKEAQLHHKPRHPADVYATWANIGKAERLLGWRPQTSYRDGIAELNDILGADLRPRFEAARPGDVKHSQADTARIELLLGFEPVMEFGEGLRQAVACFHAVALADHSG